MRSAWIIWAAMLGSLAVYAVFCILAADKLQVLIISDFPVSLVRNILIVFSAIIFVVIGNIRKFQLHAKSIGQRDNTGMTADEALRIKYMSVIVISLVLAEIIAILGLILFLLSADFTSLYLFLGISAVTMMVNCPKSGELETIIEKMKR
jgi:phosphatidylglycerophosphatase A